MSFVDQITFRVHAGHGGRGATSFRRETYVPRGGPDGGDGGRGGHVRLIADRNIHTLLDLRYRRIVDAEHGAAGGAKRCTGRDGQDVTIRLPVGTLVRDAESLELLADMVEDGQEFIVARGGRGGRGNWHFRSATRRAPTHSQPGEEGEQRALLLELKMLADVGIVGFPSVGKSTLISVISNARPKIADYPFTTLEPHLGIVRWREEESFVVADIPGIIEGAHAGAGLGLQFLRHIERCRVLLHLVEVTEQAEGIVDGREPLADFEKLSRELERFSPALAGRPVIVGLGKMDLPFVREREPALRTRFESFGLPFVSFSAAARDGLDELVDAMGQLVRATDPPDVALFHVPDPGPIPEPARRGTSLPPDPDESGAAGESAHDGVGSEDPSETGDAGD